MLFLGIDTLTKIYQMIIWPYFLPSRFQGWCMCGQMTRDLEMPILLERHLSSYRERERGVQILIFELMNWFFDIWIVFWYLIFQRHRTRTRAFPHLVTHRTVNVFQFLLLAISFTTVDQKHVPFQSVTPLLMISASFSFFHF